MKNCPWSRGGIVLGAFLFLFAAQLARLPDLASLTRIDYDQLFQLALGLKASHGAWPGLDFFTNYGPGVAVLSALSWCWHNPILAETITGALLSSIGVLAFWLAGRTPGSPFRNTLLFATLLFAAPIWAKYYYLLWPGLFLLTLGDPAADQAPRAQNLRWLLLGVIIGLGGWFRLEIGLALTAALAGALVVRWRAIPATTPRPLTLAGYATVGALTPWLIYFGAAWLVRGHPQGTWDLIDFYFTSTLAKTSDFHSFDVVPRRATYLGAESIACVLGVAVGLSALLVLVFCFPRARSSVAGTALTRRAWCAAWLLLCLSPQALHRIDSYHTLQVVASGLVAVALGLSCLLQRSGSSAPARFTRLHSRAALVAFGVLVVISGRIYFKTSPDLAHAVPRLRSLAAGLPSLDQSTPDAVLAAELRRRTAETGTILIPSLDARFYVLAGRPFAGLVPHWSFRLPERWVERQLASLHAEPAALVAYADYLRSENAPQWLRQLDFKGRNPRLDAYVDKTYPDTVYQNPYWRILAPAGSP